jgi:hypothetical protein
MLNKKALQLLEALTQSKFAQGAPGSTLSIVIVVTEQFTLQLPPTSVSTPQPAE